MENNEYLIRYVRIYATYGIIVLCVFIAVYEIVIFLYEYFYNFIKIMSNTICPGKYKWKDYDIEEEEVKKEEEK